MNMAKPTESDLDAAGACMGMLQDISSVLTSSSTDGNDDGEAGDFESFDPNNAAHLKKFHKAIRAKVRELEHRLRAPSQENLEPLRVGNVYRTLGGDMVKLGGLHNEGTPQETAFDQHGVHRYTQPSHLVGRVPGSPHDFSEPRNIAPLYTRRENGRA